MLSVDVLINAFVDEDQRLRRIVQTCPADQRDTPVPGDGLSLKKTLAHLACWDEYTVSYFEAVCGGRGQPPSFADFVATSHDRMLALSRFAFEEVLEKYRITTRSLLDLLRAQWETMNDEQHNNLFLPLKHRRHHRRLLSEHLERFTSDRKAEGLAGAAG